MMCGFLGHSSSPMWLQVCAPGIPEALKVFQFYLEAFANAGRGQIPRADVFAHGVFMASKEKRCLPHVENFTAGLADQHTISPGGCIAFRIRGGAVWMYFVGHVQSSFAFNAFHRVQIGHKRLASE